MTGFDGDSRGITGRDRFLEHNEYLKRIEPLRAELLGLAELVEGYLQEPHSPTPLSPAALDLAIDTEVGDLASLWRPVLNATLGGGLQLRAAVDHFSSLCRLLELPDTVLFSDRVLTRAGVEASARCYWLTDWKIDGRQRAARSLSERLYDLDQVDRFAGDEGRHQRMNERERFLVAIAGAGFKAQTPKKNTAYIEGGERPGPTEVIKYLLDEDSVVLGAHVQRYLSWFVHSTSTGLIRAVASDQVEDVGGGVARASFGSNTDEVNRWLAVSIGAFITAAGSYLTYIGRADLDWQRSIVNATRLASSTIEKQQTPPRARR